MSNINQILSRIVQMQSQIVSRLNKMPVIGSTGSGSDLVEINQNIEDLEIKVQNIINANSTLSTAISVLDQKISKQLSNSIITLNIKQISGSVVELSNEYNCYKLTPTATLNLEFDNSNVSEFDGGEFYLMIDLSDSIQTINFPDTFKWKEGKELPNISANRLYIFKCIYLYTDPIAYVGEFVTSVINKDYDKGVWSSDGTYQGELYVDQIDTPDYGSDQYSLIINDGSRVNQIRDYSPHGRCITVNGGEIGLLSTNDVIINGGIITTIFGSSGFISYIIRNAHITHISTELCALQADIENSIINRISVVDHNSQVIKLNVKNSKIDILDIAVELRGYASEGNFKIDIINSQITKIYSSYGYDPEYDEFPDIKFILNIDKSSIVQIANNIAFKFELNIEDGAQVTYFDEQKEN